MFLYGAGIVLDLLYDDNKNYCDINIYSNEAFLLIQFYVLFT